MNLILFITVIIVSFIAVRIGAIAFHLTGLEWSLAKFQALSCFSGTGFTTRESELITGNPQRRNIASALMVLGNAGLVTLIATFANTLRTETLMPNFTIPFLRVVFPSYLLPYINLTTIVVVLYVLYRVFNYTRFTARLTKILKARIIKRQLVKPVTFEELMVATGGYGVSQIEVCKDSPALNKTLAESGLKKHDIMVLAVERDGATIPNPDADTRILARDKLVCFGKLENIRKKLCVAPAS